MYSFHIFSLISLFVAEVLLFLAVIIFLKRPKHIANQLFALTCLAFAVWGFGEGMERASLDATTAGFWASFMSFGAIFQSVLVLHFMLVFTGRMETLKKRGWIVLPALYVFSVALLSIRLFWPELIVDGMAHNYWGYSSNGNVFFSVYMALVTLADFVAVYLAFTFRASGSSGKAARYIGLGIIFTFLMSIPTQIARPLLHLSLPEMTVTSSLAFIILTAYAIGRHGLLTITAKLAGENIVATMGDYVIVVNKEARIALINDSALVALGHEKSDLIDQPIKKVVYDGAAGWCQTPFGKASQQFPLREQPMKLLAKNGDQVDATANISILKEDDGEVVGCVFVLRDMRSTNKLISDLRRKTEELEASEVTLKKSNLELSRTNQELHKANEAMVGRELKMAELKKELQRLQKVPTSKQE